ncbi:helix-turn-helix domain-containing protein [Paraburkholderia fungorum]|uniref:helix-turn-helix transcriptional regulator n=1 Tax=Paraburkholderia fungorum TaxID=134537 RepID=UPI0038BC5A0C
MSGLGKKRVSAKDAAEFLGVPYVTISRIDRRGEFIKRYKLGHKTYVYDLESLEAFLEAKLIRPVSRPTLDSRRSVSLQRRQSELGFEKRSNALLNLLPEDARARAIAKRKGNK